MGVVNVAFDKSDTQKKVKDHRLMKCRCCSKELNHLVVDLGMSPLCENLVKPDQLFESETFYPLRLYVCDECWLVQLHDHVSGIEIFDSSYAYASSMSSTWVKHCEHYCDKVIDRFSLTEKSFVIEVASNDGYLLKNFVNRGIPCLGIEPAIRLAEIAEAGGIPVLKEYFGSQVGSQLRDHDVIADLMIGNNVLAHVPDLHDFLIGFKRVLAEQGTITFEFPHLLNLLEKNQFDTIYQEHYCYFSILALQRVFAMNGLRIYDVEEVQTHGGSLRIFVCHEHASLVTELSVQRIMDRERTAGLEDINVYKAFAKVVSEVKWQLLEFLIKARRSGKSVVGYGAPGKGNTLLNYCGIREDLLEFTVDKNPLKQNTFLVGSRIPVYEPSAIERRRPDYVLILPWNLREEIVEQLSYVRQWGAKFIVPIPSLEIID
jgi:C-methyltransferase C-terminal domain/Putative zinc binding domain/Methyltransferase domain